MARDLLGEAFEGLLGTDRWRAYPWDPVRWRPRCWAPLLRDIAAMIERGGGAQESGEALKRQAHPMFPWWHRVGEGPLSRSRFRSYMRPVRREGERRRDAGSTGGVATTEGMCREILKRPQRLFEKSSIGGISAVHSGDERQSIPHRPH